MATSLTSSGGPGARARRSATLGLVTPADLRRSPASPRRRRRAAGLVPTVALLLAGLAACAPTYTTDIPYDPADGVSLVAGDVVIRDLLVVSEGNGAPGTLRGLVVNNGPEAVTVEVSVAQVPLDPPLEVVAGGAARLDGTPLLDGQGGQPLLLDSVPYPPGTAVPVRVTTSAGGVGSASTFVLPGPESRVGDEAETTTEAPGDEADTTTEG